MEKKKTVFDFFTQVLTIFGFSMLIMNIFCLVCGDDAKEFSAMFALGGGGIPVQVAFEFLALSAWIVGVRFVFFTTVWIKRMPVWLRTVCMFAAVLAFTTCFIVAFDWFPVDMWQPWAMFFSCFGISSLASYLVMAAKEKLENRHMEEALRRLKEENGTHDA